MAVVFAKTPKGQEEVVAKSGGLTPRQRRVLIMVDGKRSVEELRSMLLADDLQNTLGLLEELELIAVTSAAGAPVAATQSLPPITAFSELPADADPLRLQMARNFMVNTVNTFVGALGSSSLLDRLARADGHDGLRALYDEWYHAIVSSRDGRREAEALRSKLLQVI